MGNKNIFLQLILFLAQFEHILTDLLNPL